MFQLIHSVDFWAQTVVAVVVAVVDELMLDHQCVPDAVGMTRCAMFVDCLYATADHQQEL